MADREDGDREYEALTRRPRFENQREAEIELQQVEEVLRLGGGELRGNEPWLYWLRHRHSDGTVMGDAVDDFYEGRSHYWYDGAPDGADVDDSGRTLRTIISFGGGFMSAPDPELYDGEGVWKLVWQWTHSGEAACPYRDWNPITRKEETNIAFVKHGTENRPRLVIEDEAKQSVEGDRCPMCEEQVGEEHGYIYLGEGYEAVYELEVQEHEDDDVGSLLSANLAPQDRFAVLLEAIQRLPPQQYDDVRNYVWREILATRELEKQRGRS